MVYSRVGSHTAYGVWKDRATLDKNSLIIKGLNESDAGRYWCEISSSGFYGLGETATDAKSTLLEVLKSNSFTCEGKSDGLYSDPNECSKYYECSEERMFHRSCAIGTVFNQYFCDFPYNVVPLCGTKGVN
uniref:chitinase n=1 Tax=Ciona savignyi TaxID=51511 RepID=H2Y673_CIOSA